MVYRLLIYFCCCIACVWSDESNITDSIRSLTQPEVTEITDVMQDKQGMLVTFPHLALKVGESGIIVRDLISYKAIVANIEVVRIQDTTAYGKVTVFNQLVQPYLPTPRLTPQKGDKVIFRSFNDKAFLIAPNEATYKYIVTQYPFINFISADLLMGFLNSQGKHDPTYKNLPLACNEYGIGLLFVVGSKNMSIFSCQNVVNIAKYPINPLDPSTTHSPFYTRANFEGGGSLMYSFSAKKSREYFKYYDTFIGDIKDEKTQKK